MVTTPWSENSLLQGIKFTFPRGGSSGVENGQPQLRDLSLWDGPLRGQAHSFHSSGWGWNIEPPAWDRRSFLMDSSRGGTSKRDIISGNHTLPGHRGAMRSSRNRSRRTLSRAPGSRAIGGNAYRRSLFHVCTIACSPRGATRTRVDSETPIAMQTDPLVPGQTPSISAPPPLDRMSAPILWTHVMQADQKVNNFPWDHMRIWHASLQSGHDRKPPWWFM